MSVTVVYRSAADLKKAEFWYEEGPKMQERAIKAEDRVDTLQIVAKENYRMYENTLAENARLRKVVDAARDLPCPIWEHSNPVEDKLWDTFITAIVELDKEGE